MGRCRANHRLSADRARGEITTHRRIGQLSRTPHLCPSQAVADLGSRYAFLRAVTTRRLFVAGVIALVSVSSAVAGRELTERDAVALVRQLPEFRAFARFAHRHHSAVDTDDNELVTDASRLLPQVLPVPAWRICVTHSVTDDPATGDGHYSKWQEFVVDARSGMIYVLWRVEDPFTYIPLSEWRRRNREFEKKT